MTAEQLLKKRYKVIADWPKNDDCNVGDILELSAEYGGEQLYRFGEAQSLWSVSDFKQYPHLFKELQWWEDRKPEDMPEYLSGLKSIRKAISYEYHGGTLDDNKTEYPSVLFEGDSVWCPIWMFQPATESEYLNYINSK